MHTVLQNQRIVWLGRDLKSSSSSSPLQLAGTSPTRAGYSETHPKLSLLLPSNARVCRWLPLSGRSSAAGWWGGHSPCRCVLGRGGPCSKPPEGETSSTEPTSHAAVVFGCASTGVSAGQAGSTCCDSVLLSQPRKRKDPSSWKLCRLGKVFLQKPCNYTTKCKTAAHYAAGKGKLLSLFLLLLLFHIKENILAYLFYIFTFLK